MVDETEAGGSEDEQGADTDTQTEEDAETVQAAEEPVHTESPEGEDGDGELVAPISLPPAAREAWKNAPKEVRDAVAKREKDFEQGIQKYAENAKRAQQMDQVLAPFSQFMQMNGGPAQTIQNLLSTGAMLQMGSPQQKAQVAASIIQQFGVDIQALDSILAGSPQPQQDNSIQQAVQQAMQPYQQAFTDFQSAQQAQAQQAQQAVTNEVDAFANDPKNEFYRDVAEDMADILDMAANRGQQVSLKQAYDRACMLHPEISTIIQSRQSAQEVEKKREAASSVSGTPNGPSTQNEPATLRQAIEQAWDTVGRL